MYFNALRRRELWLFMAGAVCIVFLTWNLAVVPGWSSWSKSAGLDGIEAIPAHVDYKRGEKHEKGMVEIALHNRGSRPVNLLEIKASCGCTLPKEMPSMVVEAGKQASLKIEVDPPGFGHRDSIVTIRTDSQATPIIQIPLQLHGQKLSPPFMHHAPDNIRVDSILGAAPSINKFQVICVETPGEVWLQAFKTDLTPPS